MTDEPKEKEVEAADGAAAIAGTVKRNLQIPDVSLMLESFAEMIRDRNLVCKLKGIELKDDPIYQRLQRLWDSVEEQMATDVVFSWDIDLSTLIGKKIAVDTKEGITRTGVLTSIRFGGAVNVFGREVALPVSIILDDEDEITFAQIVKIKDPRKR